TVTLASTGPAGRAYTITFPSGLNAVRPLVVDATQLTAHVTKQHIDISNANAGTFTLEHGGQFTGDLNWNASHTDIENALTGLSTIGSSGLHVAAHTG